MVEITAQQMHGEDEVGGHALGCIKKPGRSVEYQALHEQAVDRDGERSQDAGAPETARPAQLRPRPRRELLRLLGLVARLRLQPALQTLAIIVQQAVADPLDGSVDAQLLGMAILLEAPPAAAEQNRQRGIERGTQRPADDAINEGDLVGRRRRGGRQRRQLVAQGRFDQIIRVEPQEPIAGDPGLLDGEAPLLGVGIERPLERADIGEPSGNRQRLIGRSAVDDHDLSRPGQSLERSAYVRRFVIGQDDEGVISASTTPWR